MRMLMSEVSPLILIPSDVCEDTPRTNVYQLPGHPSASASRCKINIASEKKITVASRVWFLPERRMFRVVRGGAGVLLAADRCARGWMYFLHPLFVDRFLAYFHFLRALNLDRDLPNLTRVGAWAPT